jgi:hypothetical protein
MPHRRRTRARARSARRGAVVTNVHAARAGWWDIIRRMRRPFLPLLLVCVGFALCGARAAAPQGLDDLRRLFVSPPDDSRIMMRWWWFGPAVTKPELEREMRVMKEGGIGGFEVQATYPLALDDAASGIRNLPYLSDEFIDALRFVSDKSRELGLRMDLTLGSGWPYGGPRVPITQAAGRLRYEHVNVSAGATHVPVPAIGAGERLLAVFLAPSTTTGDAIDPASLREIATADIRDGVVWLPADLAGSGSGSGSGSGAGSDAVLRSAAGMASGSRQLLFFIASRTGMMVKRPALGAEGFVLDHYDRIAIDHYLDTVGARLMQAFDAHPPYAIFCDSLEVFQSDWTGDLLEEFQRRRHYDLKPHLPALVANVGPTTAGIRRDWGKTLTELLEERFLTPLHEWAQRHNTRLRLQGYGVPPATISSNARADLSEGEGWQWRQLQATRWASSASHLYGRAVTSSETWTWLHSPVFRATPLDMKAEADLHFLQGVNQLIGHGWPYTPEGVAYPGWRFYAAGVFNDKNPWWIVMPDLARYLQRVSFMLRQGQPANDVALYLPTDDAWARITGGRAHLLDGLRERLGPDVIAGVLDAGFDLDLFDDEALATLGLGASRYRVVILPGVETMPPDTLRQLDAFARAGGIVIATRRLPDHAPGFQATDADHRQVRDISARLFEGPAAPGHFVRDEKAALARTLAGLLQPDVAFSPAAPDIGFVHRRTDDADIYFVANTSNARQRVKAALRVEGGSATASAAAAAATAGHAVSTSVEVWNPLDGTMSAAEAQPASAAAGRATLALDLDLDPYASRIIVSHRGSAAGADAKRQKNASAGASARPSSTPPPAPIDISTDWTVTFDSRDTPASHATPTTMGHLRSWTEDDATRDFSGVATYERTVAIPAGVLRGGAAMRSMRLDFGEPRASGPREPNARMQAWLDAPVREAAVVFVNDRRVGSVWCPPYSIDITSALKPGDNRIRIQVANLAVNHMAGRALPDYRLLNLRYGVRFEAQDMDKVLPVPSGLFGPIRLIPER